MWIDAESVDRVEGDSDWGKRKSTVFLKRNPTEPYVVINKSLPDVVHAINEGLTSDCIRDLTKAVERLVEELAARRNGE